ncbi:MAG: hypothetical protein HGGPFJEG_00301 [Ignavibacteria bacterium]|nr:hypothetical protein [Ignavibacteria bacterium]
MKNSKNPPDVTAEQKILISAREIFHKKGFEGARMQEIADKAGINKALLHYYYRSKEKLFDAVFAEALKTLIPKVKELLDAELPLFDKIKYFTDNYIKLLMENMYLPVFVIYELFQNPEKILSKFTEKSNFTPSVFIAQIRKSVKNKEIKKTDPRQLFINLMSLCIYPIIAKPLIMKIYDLNEQGFNRFINQRKKEIPEFIINSIKINKNSSSNGKK